MPLDDLRAGSTEPFLGKTIKEIIMASETYIVFMDSDGVIQWVTDGSYGDFDAKFGEIQNEISCWESVCNKLFDEKEAYDFKTLLAEGYARILGQKDAASAIAVINATVDRIKSVGNQKIRMLFLEASFKSTIFIIILILIFWIFRSYSTGLIGLGAFHVVMCSFSGGIGAFISTFIRAKTYNTEITAGKEIHVFDGMLRIFYGVISGGLICLAIEANVILGFIEKIQSNEFCIKIFMSLVAGASEFLVPSIIKKVEEQVQ